MDTSFVERAARCLPPDTVMLIECAADEQGGEELTGCLETALRCGLGGEELCREPYRVFEQGRGVLLRCERCLALDSLERTAQWESCAARRIRERSEKICTPVIAGVGLGATPEEAERAVLRALFRPMERRREALCRSERRIKRASGALAVNAEGADGPWCAVKLSCCYLRRA